MGFARLTVLLGASAFLAGCEDPVAPNLDPPDHMLHAAGGSSSITATPISGTQIDVVWPDNSRNEAGFEVHRSSPGVGFTLRASTDPNVTSYRDEGLTPTTQYCYKVRSFKITGRKPTYSTFSEVACATTPNPPAPASDATAVPQNSHVVDIRWTDNSSTEAGFGSSARRIPRERGPRSRRLVPMQPGPRMLSGSSSRCAIES
jgi:hypothetical protein